MLDQITIHQLDLFLMAAKLKNFSRAADQMSISQPAFSAQIIKLEKILGTPLFERIGRRVDLTDAGVMFMEYSRKSLTALREGKQAIDDMSKKVMGVLRIGASTTIASHILPEYLGKFRTLYPHGKVEMMVGNTNQIEQALLRNEIDMGLVEGPVTNRGIEQYLFMMDELVVVYSKEHHFNNLKEISFDEFRKEPLIIRERGSGTRKVFMDSYSQKSEQPLNIVMELGNTEVIKKSAQANLGIAVLSLSSIKSEIEAGTLRHTYIEGLSFKRKLSLITLKNRYLSNPLKAFISILSPQEPVPWATKVPPMEVDEK